MDTVRYGSAFCARCLNKFVPGEREQMMGFQLCWYCWGDLLDDDVTFAESVPPNVNDLINPDDSTTAR